jgi:hypothetical protein
MSREPSTPFLASGSQMPSTWRGLQIMTAGVAGVREEGRVDSRSQQIQSGICDGYEMRCTTCVRSTANLRLAEGLSREQTLRLKRSNIVPVFCGSRWSPSSSISSSFAY